MNAIFKDSIITSGNVKCSTLKNGLSLCCQNSEYCVDFTVKWFQAAGNNLECKRGV